MVKRLPECVPALPVGFHPPDRRQKQDGGQELRPGRRQRLRGDAGHDIVAVGPEPDPVGPARGAAGPASADLAIGSEFLAGLGVPESNGPMIAAQVSGAGGVPLELGVAADDADVLRESIRSAASADALVTIGGASMGEADLVKRVLDQMGFELDFWRVRIRPGSPFSFGRLAVGERRLPVFGLPGNPASAFVTFELFVRPFLLRLAGHRRVLRRTQRCEARSDLRGPPGLTHYVRVEIDATGDPPVAVATGSQGSGLVRSLHRADGLAVVPEESDGVAAGQPVDVILLGDGPAELEYGSGVSEPDAS